MNIKEAIEKCKMFINNGANIQTIQSTKEGINFTSYDTTAIETVLAELEKKENMYRKEYNEHMEKKRQNEVLINNELILKRELEKKDKRIRDYEKGIERLKKEIEKERNTNNKKVAEMVIERLGGKTK